MSDLPCPVGDLTPEDLAKAEAVIADRGPCAGPLTTFVGEDAHVAIVTKRDQWDTVVRWLATCERVLPPLLAEVRTLRARLAECERELAASRRMLAKSDVDASASRVVMTAAGEAFKKACRERDAAIQRAEASEARTKRQAQELSTALVGRACAEDAAKGWQGRAERAEADTVARIVAWLDDPEGQPISHEMLRGYGLQDYSQRVETCRDMLAEMIKAGAWRGKEQA